MSNSFVTPRTVAHQTPLLMGFPRQEYWSGLPFPSTGDLPDPGIKPASPSWQAGSLPLDHLGSPILNGERLKASSLNSTIRYSYSLSPCGSAGKESTCNAGGLDLVTGLGRSPGEGKGYPL